MTSNQPLLDNQPFSLSGDRFSWYAKMRRESPVFYDVTQSAWMVFRYEDVKRILSDWQTFSSKMPHPPEQIDFTQNLNRTDPPQHRTLRTLVAKVFTQGRAESLAPRLRAITQELLDRVQAQGRMDFIHDFCVPFPLIVIAEILGIPQLKNATISNAGQTAVSQETCLHSEHWAIIFAICCSNGAVNLVRI